MSIIYLVGYERINGISKKTGKPYDFIKLNCNEALNKEGSRGLQNLELMLNNHADTLPYLASLKLPCKITPKFSFYNGNPKLDAIEALKD